MRQYAVPGCRWNSCRAELCSMWGGDDCLCEVFGFDPDDPPRNGTFTVVLPHEPD